MKGDKYMNKERQPLVKLKALLAEKGVEYKQLADDIEMKRDTMYKKLNGYIPFKTSEITALCEKLKISKKDIHKYFF